LIAVIIFYLHLIFACYVFCKTFQSDGVVMAFLNVAFIVVLFTVGWTLSDLITGLFISENGYRIMIPQSKLFLTFIKLTGFFKPESADYAKLLPKDPIALVFLSTIEVLFYRFFFKEVKH
jgi:hypothetical protein